MYIELIAPTEPQRDSFVKEFLKEYLIGICEEQDIEFFDATNEGYIYSYEYRSTNQTTTKYIFLSDYEICYLPHAPNGIITKNQSFSKAWYNYIKSGLQKQNCNAYIKDYSQSFAQRYRKYRENLKHRLIKQHDKETEEFLK